MRSIFRCGMIRFLLIAVAAFGLFSQARADTINLGTDYLQTLSGTFFTFPGIGMVQFTGNPIGPGNTDTIVQRLANANVIPGGAGATIPIKLVGLSLESTSPVAVGGTFFNVFVSLDPTKLSQDTGSMTILENAQGTGGTFSSFLNVFFQAKFVPVGGGKAFTITGVHLPLRNGKLGLGGFWLSTPRPGFVIVTGPCGDQDANLHTGCPGMPPACTRAPCLDFFVGQFAEGDRPIIEVSPIGRHRVRSACNAAGTCPPPIPEPSTITLLMTGLAGLLGFKRKRRHD